MRHLLTLMHDGKERTALDAAKELKVAEESVYRAMKHLREAKEIHIIDWRIPKTGGWVAVYVIGSAPDKERPSVAKRWARGEKHPVKRADKERAILAREEAERKAKAKAIKPFRDPMTSAFFGEYGRAA
jgi:hypothetical protein